MTKVRVEMARGRVHLRTDFERDPDRFEETLRQIKSIPGGHFLDSKVWSFPLDLGVCRRMRGVFGDRLVIGPQLTAWGKAELQRERALRATLALTGLEPAELTNVPELSPALYEAMLRRGYQTVAARFGADVGPHGNFDEQGLGKCIETFGALVEAGAFGNGLIVAPRTALSATWVPEIEKWLADFDVSVMLATVRENTKRPGRFVAAAADERRAAIAEFLGDSQHDFNFLLVNPEMLLTTRSWKCIEGKVHGDMDSAQVCPNKKRHKLQLVHAYPEIHDVQWDFVIGDEVQRYLINSKRKKASQVGLGFQTLKTRPYKSTPGIRIGLSGTPTKGKPKNLFPILAWIRPDIYTSQWNFNARYLRSKPNRWTQSGVEYLDEVRPEMMGELDRELSRISIRRTSGELRDLNPAWAPPPISYYEKWVDLGPQQAEQYEQMAHDASVEMRGQTITVNNALAIMTRLKEFAGCQMDVDSARRWYPRGECAKLDWLMDEFFAGLDIEAEDGPKCVVASQFTMFIDFYAKALNKARIPHFTITGATSDADRDRFRARFQKPGGPRVFLLNTMAGGISLTLDAADYGVMMDETWVPDDQDQVEKRIHRTSNVEHYVKWYYVRARGTIESEIAERTEAKDYNAKRVLDIRRGLEWARKNWQAAIEE